MKFMNPTEKEFAGPIVIAPKKNRSLRFCFTYQELNELTILETYHITRVHACNRFAKRCNDIIKA